MPVAYPRIRGLLTELKASLGLWLAVRFSGWIQCDCVRVNRSRCQASMLPHALPVGIGAVRRRNPSTALRYSAATGDATLGELAEWDPEFAEPFAPGALISASGSSERRDFPSK